MRLRSWVVIASLVVSIPASADFDVERTSSEPCIMAAFAQLLKRADGILGRSEAAAFIVRKDDGELTIVAWPRRSFNQRERFWGTVPAGTVALAHTHPSSMERPSSGDVAESVRLGLPIYVLTFWAIWAADADGQVVPIVQRRAWSQAGRGHDCGVKLAEVPFHSAWRP